MAFVIQNVNFYINGNVMSAKLNQIPQQLSKELKETGKLKIDQNQNNNVRAVWITGCPNLTRIPQNLHEFFPNLTVLWIDNCGLKEIHRADLKILKKVKKFYFWNSAIEKISSDLFADFVDIEVISFRKTKLKFIGKNAFKHLKKLKFVNLEGNPSINLIFADESCAGFIIERNTTRIYKLSEFNAIIDGMFHPQPEQYLNVQKVFISNEFKDFTIKIGENKFKVHKLMLAARSPILAEMIKNNPDADELILEDIEDEVFKVILDFIYNDVMPEKFDEKSMKVLAAAGKLKLESLKLHVGNIIGGAVNLENCLEILIYAVKNNHEDLKRKSFEEVKKFYPDINLKEDLMENLELLQKMKKLKDEFEKLFKAASN